MAHVFLTCINHPNLRWMCKEIAWTVREDGSGYYNGMRNIFFLGELPEGETNNLAATRKHSPECPCKATALRLVAE